MRCPLCGSRRARRGCPALGQTICAVCCGTKRVSEIRCPSDCGYLASAREHPAAAVRRQHEHDLAAILPSLRGLTERQHQLLFLFQSVVARHRPDGLARLHDADVADAAGAVAATLETAARGVIYEHTAASLPAQRLATDFSAFLAEARQQGATIPDREAAAVLRAIERGARETGARTGGGETAYLDVMRRLVPAAAREEPAPADPVRPSLIVP